MELYKGKEYWDYPKIVEWCSLFSVEYREFVQQEVIGHTREGRPILLLTLGKNTEHTPAMWLDAGTHASEWSGVMSALFSLSKWAEWYDTQEGRQWFEHNTIYVVPCMSPDGFQALCDGRPFLRSSTRPPKDGVFREGFEAQDIDGDGQVQLMRWRHPAGPYVIDEESDLGIRQRTLADDESEACFVCQEGLFLLWDGVHWKNAPLKYGLDLNRNFPVRWAPFEMFGMDGGLYPLSEPESRCVVEAVQKRPNIAVGLTNHTYTGALLTQPYNADSPLAESDIDLMERLALESVRGTDYRVMRVYPEFTYDPKQPVVGVWADCLTTTFGIPAYTLELWDPFAWAGVKVKEPAAFFRKPQQSIVQALLRKAVQDKGMLMWNPFQHPQLGAVEIGGIDYLRTIRNPPVQLLQKECQRGFQVADNLRRSLPKINVRGMVEPIALKTYRLQIIFENTGFLSSVSLRRAADISSAKGLRVSLTLSPNICIIEGKEQQDLGALEGWGDWQVGAAKNLVYPNLSSGSNRAVATWIVQGMGDVTIDWDAGRGGRGTETILVNESPDTHQLRLW